MKNRLGLAKQVESWTTGTRVGLGVIIFLVFLAWIGVFDSSKNAPSKPQPTTLSPKPTTPTAPPQKPASTTDQRLSEAKKALDTDYQPYNDPMETTEWGHVAEAEKHLKAIKHYDNEQQKADADKLMKEIERRKREIEKVAKKIMVQQREDLGKKLDKVFLDQGMDVEVILEGNEKDILILKYVLWGRPMVYKFTNDGNMSDGSFLSTLEKAGFKRVKFNNKSDYCVSYDLTK
ncbi:MAG: hypothetical protein KAU38_14285 [Desulfobacterales bacterium]|nr:hypothetical protein [Desulfobacterales bacterium]